MNSLKLRADQGWKLNEVEHGSGLGAFFKRGGKPHLPYPYPYPYPYPTLPYQTLPNPTLPTQPYPALNKLNNYVELS